VRFALEKELMGSPGGEEGKNIGDGNLQEDDVHDLTVRQSANAHLLEEVTFLPGGEAEVEEEKGG